MRPLTIQVPDALYEQFQHLAENHALSLEAMVIDVLEAYLESDDEETSDEVILQGLREGLEDALAGRVRPAHEVLAELEA